MNHVFLDTSYFKALIDEADDFHQEGIQVFTLLNGQKAQLITTNYIIDETLTLLRVKKNLQAAMKLRDLISVGSPTISIYRVISEDDAAAWDWFVKDWSHLSFTDCVSFAVMKRLEISHVATFDLHFKRAGFTILRPSEK